MKSKLIFLLQSYLWFLFVFIFVSAPAMMGGAHFSPLLRVLPFFLVPAGMLHLLMLFTSKPNEGLQDFAKALNRVTWFSFLAMTCFSVIKVLHNLDDSPSWISGILTPLPSFFLWTLLFSVALFVSARSVDNNAKLEQDFFPEAKQRLNIMVQGVGYAFGVLFFCSVLIWLALVLFSSITSKPRDRVQIDKEIFAEVKADEAADAAEQKFIKQKCQPMPKSAKIEIRKNVFDAEMAKPSVAVNTSPTKSSPSASPQPTEGMKKK